MRGTNPSRAIGLIAANLILAPALWYVAGGQPRQAVGVPIPAVLPQATSATGVLVSRVVRREVPAASRLFGLQAGEAPGGASARATDPPVDDGPIRLVGIIDVDGVETDRIAIIEFGSPPRIVRVRPGLILRPLAWQVAAIGTASLILQQGQKTRTITLD